MWGDSGEYKCNENKTPFSGLAFFSQDFHRKIYKQTNFSSLPMNQRSRNQHQKKIITALSAQPKVKAIYLFGSQARGEAGPLSDIDLCVLAPGVSEIEKSELLGYSSSSISVVLFDDLSLPIKVRIFREGKALYVAEQAYVDELAWRTTKEYFDFKPILQRFMGMYLPGVNYV